MVTLREADVLAEAELCSSREHSALHAVQGKLRCFMGCEARGIATPGQCCSPTKHQHGSAVRCWSKFEQVVQLGCCADPEEIRVPVLRAKGRGCSVQGG